MSKAFEMMCSLKVLRHIEAAEGLHAGSLAETGMIHGMLGWSKVYESDQVKLAVIDECCEVTYTVGAKSQEEWVAYFKMSEPVGVRVLSPHDFRAVLNALREM